MVSEALQQVLQKQQAEAAEYHHQVMRAQESEVYGHQEIVEHPFGRRDSLSSTIAQYEFPLADENNMTYSDDYEKYFGGEETDDDTLKVPPRQRGKRLAASCAVIILAALAVVVVDVLPIPFVVVAFPAQSAGDEDDNDDDGNGADDRASGEQRDVFQRAQAISFRCVCC